MGYFVLLLGPSGAGKSTIIKHLQSIDPNFFYISPFTTRQLREGEKDKVFMDRETMLEEEQKGSFLVVNELHGFRYATPKAPIFKALQTGLTPILDWPIQKLHIMEEVFSGQLRLVYIKPSSLEALKLQLSLDGRDPDGRRLKAGLAELENLDDTVFDLVIDNISPESSANQIYQFIHS